MILNNSFFISNNGLFDFDFTFLSEAFLFLLLSISITNFFLLPISKQIEERKNYINYNIRKFDILINLASETIQDSISIILDETKELMRQNNLVKTYSKTKFENEIEKIQDENEQLLRKVKVSFLIKSAEKFSFLNKEINEITESIFQNKFLFD